MFRWTTSFWLFVTDLQAISITTGSGGNDLWAVSHHKNFLLLLNRKKCLWAQKRGLFLASGCGGAFSNVQVRAMWVFAFSVSFLCSSEQLRYWGLVLWRPLLTVLLWQEGHQESGLSQLSVTDVVTVRLFLFFLKPWAACHHGPPLWSDRVACAVTRTLQGTGGFGSTVLTTDQPPGHLGKPLSSRCC